ncbi:MAG TPA: hypothetical protein VK773_08940 [Acidimicrobiales bacterium]|nr:hypothetical protein [Acidimicrobiales bacterium]
MFVEVEGAPTTVANPASLAADTGTSTLADNFDPGDVDAAAGTTKIDPATAAAVAMLAAAKFRVNFRIGALLSKRREGLAGPIGRESFRPEAGWLR